MNLIYCFVTQMNYNFFMKLVDNILNGKKNIVFVDFEGTQYSQEIFAIGAVKVSLNSKNQIKSSSKPFRAYIKVKGQIGPIIEKITGISEVFLQNNGKNLSEVLTSFRRYVGNNYSKSIFMCYGNFDKKMIANTLKNVEAENDELLIFMLKNLIDFSSIMSIYIKDNKGQQLSLKEALKTFNITFEGKEHDPSDDAINLMFLYNTFLIQKGIVAEEYKKTLNRYSKMPWPIIKLVRELNKNGSVTIEQYNEFIEEELK